MSRVPSVDPAAATAEVHDLYDSVNRALGATPNFIRVLANSPAALRGFLGLYAGTVAGSLDAATRERIALAVAQQNGCEYCLSAHTAIGRKLGLPVEEILAARAGRSSDARAAAAVSFAKLLVERRGEVTAVEHDALRAAGYSDREVIDIVAVVALNVMTNLLNRSLEVDIDFPRVSLARAA